VITIFLIAVDPLRGARPGVWRIQENELTTVFYNNWGVHSCRVCPEGVSAGFNKKSEEINCVNLTRIDGDWAREEIMEQDSGKCGVTCGWFERPITAEGQTLKNHLLVHRQSWNTVFQIGKFRKNAMDWMK
jgi:hypothetical protein